MTRDQLLRILRGFDEGDKSEMLLTLLDPIADDVAALHGEVTDEVVQALYSASGVL